ncbi:MAG: MmcQ/YjbR family DNA-binding protein [Polyangiaceae bacterium]|nr:MmcQ/YjbR family DNA-binding protein [Polyangiaceae bacterium]
MPPCIARPKPRLYTVKFRLTYPPVNLSTREVRSRYPPHLRKSFLSTIFNNSAEFGLFSLPCIVQPSPMARRTAAPNPEAFFAHLQTLAKSFDGVEENVACKGTKVESATFKVKGKAFAFLRPTQLMFKLSASLTEASGLAAAHPESIRAGAGGWVTLPLPLSKPIEPEWVEKWMAESYALFNSTAKAPASAAGRSPRAKKK